MKIFELSKSFPTEEKYSLTDLKRRSSRSECSTIAKAYRIKRYPKHFTSKLTDSDGENSETTTWLDLALDCKYISKEAFINFSNQSKEFGKLINYMINNPDKFGVKID